MPPSTRPRSSRPIADFGSIDVEDDNAFDPHLMLVAVTGSSQFQLRRRLTRIGRNPDNDVALNNDRVSRYHAEIVRDGDAMTVVDKESRNGVWLNGQRIKASAELRPGDRATGVILPALPPNPRAPEEFSEQEGSRPTATTSAACSRCTPPRT